MEFQSGHRDRRRHAVCQMGAVERRRGLCDHRQRRDDHGRQDFDDRAAQRADYVRVRGAVDGQSLCAIRSFDRHCGKGRDPVGDGRTRSGGQRILHSDGIRYGFQPRPVQSRGKTARGLYGDVQLRRRDRRRDRAGRGRRIGAFQRREP